ncbi:TauD/TfdA family dioxygenase [Acanthopleuribacter pedis]|uniref:TauD/TfdA family dioxygenase n=1 Tax=Acanthopleuribacter pedis TaxID=442870 RepID=A0A8J7QDM0_9BACT|nr:TauD/TfdA family dioxygenase [Acanthopleuribacter pedis]MBO1322209.1 TauD/TfdA family dioxygenase [Acanthopleuribacter pedis]
METTIPKGRRGSEILRCPDFEVTLTEQDTTELDAALHQVKQQGLPLEAVTRDQFILPKLGPRLTQIQHDLEHGCGACRLRGLPVTRYSVMELEIVFWGLTTYIGTPRPQSADGKRLFHVSDAGFGESDAKTRGPNSNKRLRFHTDRCDVIGFLTVRQALQGGDNLLLDSRLLYHQIQAQRPDLLEVLKQPFAYLRHNVDTANPLPYITQPIFAVENGVFCANVLRVLIDRAHNSGVTPPMTDQQIEALDLIDTLAEDENLHLRFRQEPGDLLFVNNFMFLHRRDAFTDAADPNQRRLLLRLWLSMPNSRPLPESFRGMYRNIGAGALRGGMPTRAEQTESGKA